MTALSYETITEYAKQDGLHQWFREFVGEFRKERPDLLAAIRYVSEVHAQCPDRVDEDHDDYCRKCAPFLWLTTGKW